MAQVGGTYSNKGGKEKGAKVHRGKGGTATGGGGPGTYSRKGKDKGAKVARGK